MSNSAVTLSHIHRKLEWICAFKHSVSGNDQVWSWRSRWLIQDEVSAYDVLEKGLTDLSNLCDVVVDKFTTSRDDYNALNPKAWFQGENGVFACISEALAVWWHIRGNWQLISLGKRDLLIQVHFEWSSSCPENELVLLFALHYVPDYWPPKIPG